VSGATGAGVPGALEAVLAALAATRVGGDAAGAETRSLAVAP